MLEWIRKKFKGFLILFITGIITLIFILGSTSFLLNRNTNNHIVAKVNDYDISLDLVNAIYAEHLKKYANNKINNYNIEPKNLKQHIVKDLIKQTAIISSLKQARFIVNQEEIIQFINNNPQFQENGSFSLDKYTQFFKHAPFSELEYQQYVIDYLLQQQLHNSIFLSNFVSPTEVNNFITEIKQTRNFGVIKIPYKKFINSKSNTPQITNQQITDYYNQHKTLFINPATVSINYIDINKNNFINNDPVDKNELFKYYQEHAHYYTLPELINVRHILVTEDKTAIEKILSELKAGANFTELAKKYSQDQASATTGGELGWIARGETDIEFEKAAFSLKNPGDISNVITSSFGYHLIQLNQRRDAQTKEFANLIPEITKNYKEEIANNTLQTIAEELENGELANDDLNTIASKFNLEVKSAGPFTNKGAPTGIASYSQIIMAAFDDKYLNKNSHLIKLNDERFVVLKIINKQPATSKTLAQATPEITTILQKNAAIKMAQEQGLELANKLMNDNNNKLWLKINNATRDQQINDLSPQILKTAFALTLKNNQTSFTMDNGDFVIIKLWKINNITDLSKQPVKEVTQQLTTLQAMLEQKMYEQDLIKNAKIKLLHQEILTDKEQI